MNRELTFAEWWTSPDQIDRWERSRRKCAEVLVPDAVPASFIEGAYVSCDESLAELRAVAPELPIEVNRHLFFL